MMPIVNRGLIMPTMSNTRRKRIQLKQRKLRNAVSRVVKAAKRAKKAAAR